MPYWRAADCTATFETDPVGEYAPSSKTAYFSHVWLMLDVSLVHAHRQFVIPYGAIDGVNATFGVFAKAGEVIVNGIKQDVAIEDGWFVLSTPPRPGDILWVNVEL